MNGGRGVGGLGWAGRVLVPILAFAFVLGLCSTAAAQSSPPKLTTNQFTIDLVEGPVLGASRIVGLGGAYTALASGIDASPWNPAAYGARELWELDWFEFDVDVGFLLPAFFALNDYFNTDTDFQYDDFLFFSFGGRFILGNTGVGALSRIRSFHISDEASNTEADVTFSLTNAGVAQQFFDGQLVVGAGVRVATVDFVDSMSDKTLVSEAGAGFEAGMLLRLASEQWRLGAALRTPVSSNIINLGGKNNDPTVVEGFLLPRDVYLPWEVTAGIAISIGERPMNRRWYVEDYSVDSYRQLQTLARIKREREELERELGRPIPTDDPYAWLPQRAQDPTWLRDEKLRRRMENKSFDDEVAWNIDARQKAALALSRDYVLLSVDVVVTGATSDGISLEGFLSQQDQPSGRDVTLGVRFGAESEPVPRWVKIRAGGYVEPSRTPGGDPRLHATTGVDARVFTWDIFGLVSPFTLRVGATVDVAPRYFDWGFSLGMWH